MDYLDHVDLSRHVSFAAFESWRSIERRRLVLLTTRADQPYLHARFHSDDIVMVGRETAGVPDEVHRVADLRLAVPMRPPARSLNVAVAAAMVIGEALRQITEDR